MRPLAVALVGLVAIFVISFMSAVTALLLLAPAVAVVVAFIAARLASTITRSCLVGGLTGWAAMVAFVYGIFMAYEVGWRNLDMDEWVRSSHSGVAADIRFWIFYGGFLTAVIGSVVGLLAYATKSDKPRW